MHNLTINKTNFFLYVCRYSDIQASYLVEGKFSVPSESSPSSQSEGDPREKLQLSFQDDE